MFGGIDMDPLQITLLVIVVLVIVTAVITYFVRSNYYKQIDELDKEKSEVLNSAPYDELKEVAELNITGQSYELRQKLERQWKNIESAKYPRLENFLFEAEQATDRYRLGESKRNQNAAKSAIDEVKNEIHELKKSLTELIEREQANLEKIDEIKKRYHEVRKSLLAYSFSFGPASESFEEKLRSMEDDFRQFSDFTVSGDHEEAKEVVEKLGEDIQYTETQMDEVPSLLSKVEEDFTEQLEDLKAGYAQMSNAGYLFPNDTILEDIEKLENDKTIIYNHIRLLELEEANDAIQALGLNIDEMYDRMEMEYEAKPEAAELIENSKKALYFLQDENRRLNGVVNRMVQSYILNHNEEQNISKLSEEVKEARAEYDLIDDRMKHQALPYSVAYTELYKLFNHLNRLNSEYRKISDGLENYRKLELAYKKDLKTMEQDMYTMKRRLENERLPGLPDDYLELFFSTTDRIEQLSNELARPKIQLVDIQRIHGNCMEDIKQLKGMADEIVNQVELIERTSQRLYRYKDTHKGVLETIRYSESLFTDDYDYETSLRMVREKLENVAPGEYAKIETEYYYAQKKEEENK